MKKQTFSSLGLEFEIDVPSTVTEFDKLAKKEGACLAEAINNVAYRGVLADFRDTFLHGREADKENGQTAFKGLDEITKISRKLKDTGRKNDKKEPIMVYAETEKDFFDRICAERKVEPKAFQDHCRATAAVMKFDPSQKERKPAGPKKLANKYKETASAIIKGPHLNRFLTDLKKALGVEWVAPGKDEAVNAESLGWQVKALADYKEKQALASFTQ
jgi:hypothetical protein